jgi:hypothetical protein
MFKLLNFKPVPGLTSPSLQMIVSNFSPPGSAPQSQSLLVTLTDGDLLSCEVSTPPNWQPHDFTIAMVHGLGGSHLSSYMIRLSRKFFQQGLRVVRINLRGCGTGHGLNRLPYNNGNSDDVRTVLETLKAKSPLSPIALIGFSLGGNITLKMAGELGDRAPSLLNRIFAVCPVLDIADAVYRISQKKNWVYHNYYLRTLRKQGKKWLEGKVISSMHDIDEQITAPLWGYKNAQDYYEKCSSCKYVKNISVPCDLLLSADDPFIDYTILKHTKLSPSTNVWITPFGSHMGFLGKTSNESDIHWMDHWLLSKVTSSQNS